MDRHFGNNTYSSSASMYGVLLQRLYDALKTVAIASEMPHGGYKQSGFGKDMSLYLQEDYTQITHVMVDLLDAPVIPG